MSDADPIEEVPAPEQQKSSGGGLSRRDALAYMAPVVVAAVLPLVTLPIFTRVLTREEYGLWGVATAVGALASGILGLGLHTGFERSYFAANDDATRGRLLYTIALTALGAQLLGFLVVIGLGASIAREFMGSENHAGLLALAYLLYAVAYLKSFLLTTLRNEGRARAYATFSIDDLFLGAVLSVAGVLWLRLGPAALFLGPLVASLTITGVLAVQFLRRIERRFDQAQLRETLHVSLPLAPRIAFGAAGNQLDKLVLGAIGSLANVGVYTIGQRMAQFVFAFMTAIQNLYQPTVYRLLFTGAAPRRIGDYLLPFAYASAAVAFGVVLFADEIVRIVTPPEYALAGPVLAILAVHYGLMFFGKQPQLIFAKRTDLLSLLSIGTVVVNAGAVYVGAVMGGAEGAAVGLLTGGVLTGGVALVVAARFAPIHYALAATVGIFGALPAALILVLTLRTMGVPLYVALPVKIAALIAFAVVGWRSDLLGILWRTKGGIVATPPAP